MSNSTTTKRSYPWTTQAGGRPVTFRLLERKEKDLALEMARTLPQDDMLFLTLDITNPQSIDLWFHNIENNKAKMVLAESEGKLVGVANLTYNQLPWTRHLGDIWMLVAPDQRGRGLGKLLINEVFVLAHELGLKKLVAQMASEQRGAIQVFEKLDFKAEALLADHVIDRKGQTHDLVVMSYDVDGFSE